MYQRFTPARTAVCGSLLLALVAVTGTQTGAAVPESRPWPPSAIAAPIPGPPALSKNMSDQIAKYAGACQETKQQDQTVKALCEVDWKQMYDRATNLVKGANGSAEVRQALKKAPKTLQSNEQRWAWAREVVRTSEDYLEKFSQAKKAFRTIKSSAFTGVGAALSNAISNSDVWGDPSATPTEKAYAVLGSLPVVGEMLGFVKSAQKEDVEGVIVNTLALAGIIATFAFPPAALLIEAIILGYNVVKVFLSFFTQQSGPFDQHSAIKEGFVRANDKEGVGFHWATPQDERAKATGSRQLRKHYMIFTSNAPHEALLREIRLGAGALEVDSVVARAGSHDGPQLAKFTCQDKVIDFICSPSNTVPFGKHYSLKNRAVYLELTFEDVGAPCTGPCPTQGQRIVVKTQEYGSNPVYEETFLTVTGQPPHRTHKRFCPAGAYCPLPGPYPGGNPFEEVSS
ncbi:hypothetical protein [Streptomyces luteireticuli]|uniref:hypothetical protein n=1 Tax=Streptomyces luteireticuli TaxID=173858 RepID=UPI0035565678